MNNDIERLPKWAQKEIEYLRRDLASAKAELCEIRERSFGGTGIVSIEKFSINEPNLVLPDRSPITFIVGESWEQKITIYHEGASIKIMGGMGIKISPSSSNVINVEVEE